MFQMATSEPRCDFCVCAWFVGIDICPSSGGPGPARPTASSKTAGGDESGHGPFAVRIAGCKFLVPWTLAVDARLFPWTRRQRWGKPCARPVPGPDVLSVIRVKIGPWSSASSGMMPRRFCTPRQTWNRIAECIFSLGWEGGPIEPVSRLRERFGPVVLVPTLHQPLCDVGEGARPGT